MVVMYPGIHYVHEDVLMIQHPMLADFAMDLVQAGGPYPAKWFDFKVTNGGPVIPETSSKEDMLDLMDM